MDMAQLKDDMKDFFAESQADKNGEFVRLEFFDQVDFDPNSDEALAKMGDWRWNDEHTNLMLITADPKDFDEDVLFREFRKNDIPVTAFELRHEAAKDVRPLVLA
jgi:uncharacterized membrane protein YvbJ